MRNMRRLANGLTHYSSRSSRRCQRMRGRRARSGDAAVAAGDVRACRGRRTRILGDDGKVHVHDAVAVRLQRRGQPDAAGGDAVGRPTASPRRARSSSRSATTSSSTTAPPRRVVDLDDPSKTLQLSALLSRRHQAARRDGAARHGAAGASRVRLLGRRGRARRGRRRAASVVGDARRHRRARHGRRAGVRTRSSPRCSLRVTVAPAGGDGVHHADAERVGAQGAGRSGGDAAQGAPSISTFATRRPSSTSCSAARRRRRGPGHRRRAACCTTRSRVVVVGTFDSPHYLSATPGTLGLFDDGA